MDGPFIYHKYVTGKSFIGRKSESQILSNLLQAGENIVMYEAPNTGQKSLIQQTLMGMRMTGAQFSVAELSLLRTRETEEFLLSLCGAVLKTAAKLPSEFEELIGRHLGGTHFVFDAQRFEQHGEAVSLKGFADAADITAAIELPYRVAAGSGEVLYLIISEFQNIMQLEDGDAICRNMSQTLRSLPEEMRKSCRLIFSGSCVNAMKDIFEFHTYFNRLVERVQLLPIDDKTIIEHVVKGFLAGGKVIDRDLLLGVNRLFKCNIWYINHFCSICDALSKGYIMEPTLVEALEHLISIHSPRFRAVMNNLTTFQVRLLRAVIDGNYKFSSSAVIKEYGLSSSANVRRLKDALCKKEIITFDEHDEPQFLDPLFEYWVRTVFFGLKAE